MSTAALRPLALVVVGSLLAAGLPQALSAAATAGTAPDHLVISEVVTGGVSASDEFVEIYNPTTGPLPLEGLELVYVSASGLTVSRRAAWEVGAPEVPPGGHVLVAHELGAYAAIADAHYASGMAATGGSVAIRIIGASSAVDAVGWGTATGTWREGAVAPAPAAGSSIERLPGGALGSTQDTDDNATDFVVRTVPGPENSASDPVPAPTVPGSPAATAAPTTVPTIAPTAAPTATPSPTPVATPTPFPSPTDDGSVVSIATARALPDGSVVTIEGVALTGSTFTDGGGYLADASGAVAVLIAGGAFERGALLRVRGEIDDRYAQRTLRAEVADLVLLGTAPEPDPQQVATGSVGEPVEGRLVRVAGTITGAPTALSSGLAFDIDDGSGLARLLVATSTEIDVSEWGAGIVIDAVGVVGQRDSSGTGASGYRVQPRDAADIRAVTPPLDATASSAPTASPATSSEPGPGADVISVAAARQLPKGSSATVAGVVTLAPRTVDPTTAVIQDASGAIMLRVGEHAGSLVRGMLVEVRGVRSTLSGMETLRVVDAPRSLGSRSEPGSRMLRTADAGEAHEAVLVTVRGGIVAKPRRSSAGTISFELDDGSGPLRVSIGAATGIGTSDLTAGTWVEVRGVLGQETTGSLPLRGYRVWPRDAADLRVTAPASGEIPRTGGTGGDGVGGSSGTSALESLGAVGSAADPNLAVGATLVIGRWDALGVGGLLWDGARLVALTPESGTAVDGLLRARRPPIALQINGLRAVGVEPDTGAPLAEIRNEPAAVVATGLPPAPPQGKPDLDDGAARWVALVGRLAPRGEAMKLIVGRATVLVDWRCDAPARPSAGIVSVTGVLGGDPPRLIVPCDGITPAPALAGATVERDAENQSRQAVAFARPGVVEPVRPPSGLAGVLLLAAAATLLIGALAVRVIGRGTEPEELTGGGMADHPVEPGSPPSLTLVPVPRERAP